MTEEGNNNRFIYMLLIVMIIAGAANTVGKFSLSSHIYFTKDNLIIFNKFKTYLNSLQHVKYNSY